MFSPEFIAKANMLVMLVARFAATQTKYGPRGYRYLLLEAGHAAQNLCLSATELGCAALCVGGFDDDALKRALGLRVLEAGVLYCVAVGYPGLGDELPRITQGGRLVSAPALRGLLVRRRVTSVFPNLKRGDTIWGRRFGDALPSLGRSAGVRVCRSRWR